MDLNLHDKVVLVSGATANIGRAIALGFATEGARVVIIGRDEEAARSLASDSASFVTGQVIQVDAGTLL